MFLFNPKTFLTIKIMYITLYMYEMYSINFVNGFDHMHYQITCT